MQPYCIISRKPEWIRYGEWLAAPRTMDVFSGDRILIQAIRNPSLKKRIVATWTDKTFITRINVYSLLKKTQTKTDLCFLLSILNSRLMNWLLKKDYGLHTYIITGVLALPIKGGKPADKHFIDLQRLSRSILAAKAADPAADTSALEREIDRIVYELYGLTEE